MSADTVQRLEQILVSGVIVFILTLQTGVIVNQLVGCVPVTGNWYWPFMDYPMYRQAHYEGELVERYRIFGTTTEMTEVSMTPEDLGMNFWKFQEGPVYVLQHADNDGARRYARLYEERHDVLLTRLRLENHPLAFTREGLNPAAVEVVETAEVGRKAQR